MGPKARPIPKPHATSVRNKFGKIQASTPKPWPKRRATPLSLQSSSSGSQQVAVAERTNVFRLQHHEQRHPDELQLILSQAFSPPPEGRFLASVPSRPQPVTLQEDSQKQTDRILKWLEVFSEHSSIAEQLSRSKHPKEHLTMMLKQIEPSTIKRYLNGFEKFVGWLQFDHTLSWTTLQPYHLADFLVDTTKKTSDWCYKPPVLALTWAAKTLGLQSLQDAIQSPLIQSFVSSKVKPPLNIDLIPITLGMAYTIEKALLDLKSDISILPLGTFLLMFWAGLRFSDVQRVKVSSLSISSGLLRGRTWKSKNAKQGYAFSCITSGLLGTHSSNWASQWFQFLKDWWKKLEQQHKLNIDPDFLLPTVNPKSGDCKPIPMAHFQACIWLRLVLNLPPEFKPTLHALKAGLIAVGKQLTLPAEWLSEQGHHAPKSSTNTYTREDTFFQLRLQVAIMVQVQKGWRPVLPQARGSEKPLKDIEFKCLGWLSWDWLFPDEGSSDKQVQHKMIKKLPVENDKSQEIDSSSSEDSSSSSSEDVTPAKTESKTFLLNHFNLLAHIGMKKDGEMVPACGATLGLPNRFYKECDHLPDDFTLCNRKPCVLCMDEA